MGLFNILKKDNSKNNTQIIVTSKQCLEEIYFMLNGISSLGINDIIIDACVIARHDTAKNAEMNDKYIKDMWILQQKIIDILVTTTNIPLSSIIPPIEIANNCLYGMVASAYYSGQSDAYNDHINVYLEKLSKISIIASPFISSEERAKNALNYVLTSTEEGKEMCAFPIAMGSLNEEFLQGYFNCLCDMQTLHLRDKQLLFGPFNGFDQCYAKFANSACGKRLLTEEFEASFEEIVLLSCVYLIARLRVDYNVHEIFNEAMNYVEAK